MAESNSDEISGLFEEELHLPSGFFKALLHEDDWSFLIKLHAFFEAVITNFLVVSLEREDLRDTLSHIPLSDKKFGKMEFVRALSLLSERPLKFISALSELRNRLVHDVKNVNFDLKVYVGGLDSNQLKNFRRNFGFFFESIENGEAELGRLLAERPKIVVLISAYECLMQIHFKKQDARIQRMDAELARLVYERHRAESPEE